MNTKFLNTVLDVWSKGKSVKDLASSTGVYDAITNTYGVVAAFFGKSPGAQLGNLMWQGGTVIKAESEGKLSSKEILGTTAAVVGTIAAVGLLVGASPLVAIASAVIGVGLSSDWLAAELKKTADWYSDPENLSRVKGELLEQFPGLDIDKILDTLAFSGADVDAAIEDAFNGAYHWLSEEISSVFSSNASDLGGGGKIDKSVNESFLEASNFVFRVDPLTLDLDGDGIETVSSNAGITFDFDGDGVKTGTGWVKGDDGFLVLDLNGNGKVDSGRELFGVDTIKRDGTKASNGFDALKDLDSNGDGVFDAQDSRFGDVRVWQDKNQDGVSQADELKSLADLHIKSIGLVSNGSSQNSGDNVVSAVGSFVYDDGHAGAVNGNQSLAANLDLASNPFYREFTDKVEIDAEVARLPNMRGSGAARDLLEAASGNLPLALVLQQYSQAKTRADQQALLGTLVAEWAATANFDKFPKRIDAALEGGEHVRFEYSWETQSNAGVSPTNEQLSKKALLEKISILEIFNGQAFLNFTQQKVQGDDVFISIGAGASSTVVKVGHSGAGSGYVLTEKDLSVSAQQAIILTKAYDQLLNSIYESLLLKTRLKPYVDAISLKVTSEGVEYDYTHVLEKLSAALEVNQVEGIVDAFELRSALEPISKDRSFNTVLSQWLSSFESGGAKGLVSTLSGVSGFFTGTTGQDYIVGTERSDLIYGGAGDDYLVGGDGGDTYLFYKGDGFDTIVNTDKDEKGASPDRLVFGGGIKNSEVSAKRSESDLILRIAGGTDGALIKNYFNEGVFDNYSSAIDEIVFQDGTLWTIDTIKEMVVRPTDGDDILWGYRTDDTLFGGLGDDTIYGLDGNDTLDGGAGNDRIFGGKGNDLILGGGGDDILVGDEGDDVLDGGAGRNVLSGEDGNDILISAGDSDHLAGGDGNDVYVVGDGPGNTTIDNFDVGAGRLDTLRLGQGFLVSNTIFSRSGYDLIISAYGIQRSVSVSQYFKSDEYKLDLIEFSSVSAWDQSALEKRMTIGTDGDDVLYSFRNGGVLDGGAGNDVLWAFEGNDTLLGGDGDDQLYGGEGDDQLYGGSGNDILYSGAGNNVLDGGSGNDIYESDKAGSDTYIMRSGGGHDRIASLPEKINIFLDGVRVQDISITFDYRYLIVGIPGGSTLTIDGLFYDTIGARQGIQFSDSFSGSLKYDEFALNSMVLQGGSGDDHLYGFDRDDVIRGGSGNDVLDGRAGDDVLVGGQGDDSLVGGMGNDTYVFSKGDGADTINDSDVVSAVNTIRFTDVKSDELIIYTQNNVDLVFRVKGTTDKLVVTGYYVADEVRGGVIYNNKIDRVEFSDGKVWGASDFEEIKNNAVNNRPVVVGAAPILRASVGEFFSYVVPENFATDSDKGDKVFYDVTAYFEQDRLPGWLKFDPVTRTLSGTPTAADIGKPRMVLWAKDSYEAKSGTVLDFTVGNPNRAPVVRAPQDDQFFVEGQSFIYSLASVFSDPDNDVLSYSAKLSNGAVLPVWLKINSATGQFSGTVPVGAVAPLNIVVTASDPFGGSVSSAFNVAIQVPGKTLNGTSGADKLVGGAGDDTLNGNAGNDTLIGNAGNDLLNGGAGNDTMTGGTGDDVYIVDSVSDVTIELPNEGIDTVESSVTWTLSANVENLYLTGKAAINGTGNALDNTIVGNSAANTLTGGAGNDSLDGRAGADRMVGGLGDDTYYVDNVGDVVVENANEGVDSVESSISYTLGSNVENLTLADGAAINGTGNVLDNIMIGNSSSNILTGGAGNDRLEGRGGADTLIGGTGNDTYVMARGFGRDTIIDTDATVGNQDQALFSYNITSDQLWFRQLSSTNDLEVSVMGTTDAFVVKDWFSGSANHVEKFVASDGKVLLDSQVQNLVNAMASFSPPTYFQTTLSDNAYAGLAPVLAASWK